MRSIAACVAAASAGTTGASPKSTTLQRREGVDPGGQVAAGRGARRADRARGEARPGPVGDELVGGRADDRDVDADEVVGVLGVGLAGEAQQAREVGLLAVLGPAQRAG